MVAVGVAESWRGRAAGPSDHGGLPWAWRCVAVGRSLVVLVAESCHVRRGELSRHGAFGVLSRGQLSAAPRLSAAQAATLRDEGPAAVSASERGECLHGVGEVGQAGGRSPATAPMPGEVGFTGRGNRARGSEIGRTVVDSVT